MAPKLKLPPGIYSNGTDNAGAGKWISCDLIRWEQDVLKTIGGWQPRALVGTPVVGKLFLDPTEEAVRSGIAVSGVVAGAFTYFGSNKEIYYINAANGVSIVTPAEFDDQPKDASTTGGYGTYVFGTGLYGTPRPAPQGNPDPAFSWGFTAWGEDVIACARRVTDQSLYVRAPTDALFLPISTSPVGTADVIVTDERIVMTVGTSADKRLVLWSDRENYAEWAPAITNMAGSYRLAGTGDLLAITKVQNQLLILSENEAFIAQFLGPPYIYGFNAIGEKCGVESALALATASSFAMWFGMDTFWIYDGTLKNIACSLLEFLLQDMEPTQKSKMCAFTNSDFDEVWWLYQSTQSDDCDSYVVYNYKSQIWYHGRIDRTCGVDDAALKYLTMVGKDGVVYDHEIAGAGYSGAAPFIASGPLEVEGGSRLFGMSYIFPDDTGGGNVQVQIEVRDFPKQPPIRTVTFDLLDPTSTIGILGRDLRMKFYSTAVNEMWTLGDMRVEPVVAPTGRR